MRGSFLLFSVPATDISFPPALILIVLVYSVVSPVVETFTSIAPGPLQ